MQRDKDRKWVKEVQKSNKAMDQSELNRCTLMVFLAQNPETTIVFRFLKVL